MPSEGDIPDKQYLYGQFEAGQQRRRERTDWRENLSRLLAYKSLDIADEEMAEDVQISQNIKRGIGLPELALIVLGMGGSAVGGAVYMQQNNQAAPPPAVIPAADHGVEWDFYQPDKEATDGSR